MHIVKTAIFTNTLLRFASVALESVAYGPSCSWLPPHLAQVIQKCLCISAARKAEPLKCAVSINKTLKDVRPRPGSGMKEQMKANNILPDEGSLICQSTIVDKKKKRLIIALVIRPAADVSPEAVAKALPRFPTRSG